MLIHSDDMASAMLLTTIEGTGLRVTRSIAGRLMLLLVQSARKNFMEYQLD